MDYVYDFATYLFESWKYDFTNPSLFEILFFHFFLYFICIVIKNNEIW